MVTINDSSFSSASTEESFLSGENTSGNSFADSSNHDSASRDTVVKEEAREWKESVHKATTSPQVAIPVAMATTPVAMVTPISSSTPYFNSEKNSFHHLRLTETGLVPRLSDSTSLQKCTGCKRSFSTQLNLSRHECLKLKCAACGFRSSTEEGMYSHVSTQHKAQLYKCGICDQGFKSPEYLEIHLNSAHDTPYSCSKCGLVFVKFDLFQTHVSMECSKDSHSDKEECGECDTLFDSAIALEEHMSTKHLISTPVSMTSPLTSLSMSPCFQSNLDLSLSTQALLLKHSFLQKLVADLQNSLDKNPLLAMPLARFPPAAKCSNLLDSPPLFYPTAIKPLSPEFAKYGSMTSPEHTKYGSVTSPDITKYGSVTSPDLTKYSEHLTSSLLKCNQCSASFTTFSELHSHLLVHTVAMTTTPHQMEGYCGECDTNFPDKVSIDDHTKNAHESERPYKCNHCDKTFTRSNNLQEHLRTHTGSRPYVCSYCDKSFARSSILHIHMRTHTKIKPFQCSVCPAAFSHSNSLQAHLRRHTGAKPYVCPVCSKAFRQSGTLHRHIRTHNKAKRADQLISPKQDAPKTYTHGNYTGNHGDYTGSHGNFAGSHGYSESYANLALKLLGELRPEISRNKENQQPDLKSNLQFMGQFKQSI